VALFPRGDARALATALQRLAAEPAERRRQAAAPAPPRLDAAAHLSRLLALYAELAARPRPAPADPAAARAAAESLARRERAFLLREAGLKELLRSEGWEDVVARLQAENEALKHRT